MASETKFEARGDAIFLGNNCIALFNTDVDTKFVNEMRAAMFARAMNSHDTLFAALREISTICRESNSDCRKRMGTRVGNCLVTSEAALKAVSS